MLNKMARPVGACATVNRVFEPPVCFNVSHCDATTLCTACDGAWVVLGDACTCSGSCLHRSPPMTLTWYLFLKLAANTSLLVVCIVTQAYVHVYVEEEAEMIGGIVFFYSILTAWQLYMDVFTDIQGATFHDRIQLAGLTCAYYWTALLSFTFLRACSRRRRAERAADPKEEGLLQEAVAQTTLPAAPSPPTPHAKQNLGGPAGPPPPAALASASEPSS